MTVLHILHILGLWCL